MLLAPRKKSQPTAIFIVLPSDGMREVKYSAGALTQEEKRETQQSLK
jgi:hypothetical protein